ncbi:MAG: hypothetical protein JWP17_2083, partial [Solirubrobacterales bacterium]|nr:hypothetical protein [Solirubrobacterales bacterium]
AELLGEEEGELAGAGLVGPTSD